MDGLRFRQACAVFTVISGLTACATTDKARVGDEPLRQGKNGTIREAFQMHRDIPEDLVALQSVYGLPNDPSCEGIIAEQNAWELTLGQEFDLPLDLETRGFGARAAELGRGATVAKLMSYIGPLLIIGALANDATEKQRDYAEAVDRARRRRAFLRGLAVAAGCENTTPVYTGDLPDP